MIIVVGRSAATRGWYMAYSCCLWSSKASGTSNGDDAGQTGAGEARRWLGGGRLDIVCAGYLLLTGGGLLIVMTAMKGFVEAERDKDGLLGVHSVDHFGLVVPDLKAAEHLYSASGIDTVAIGDRLGLRASISDHA